MRFYFNKQTDCPVTSNPFLFDNRERIDILSRNHDGLPWAPRE